MSKTAILSPKFQTKFLEFHVVNGAVHGISTHFSPSWECPVLSHGMDQTVHGILMCPTLRYTPKSQCPMDGPIHPMGLGDGMRLRGLGVYLEMGHMRIPWTVLSIYGTVGQDGTVGFRVYLWVGHVKFLGFGG